MHGFSRRLNGGGERTGWGGSVLSPSYGLVELHDLRSVPLPGSSILLRELRQAKGCINGWSRGTPTPCKHKRPWQHQPATEAFTVSNRARKDASIHQGKQRSLQLKPQGCTNHHVLHPLISSISEKKIEKHIIQKTTVALWKSEGEDGLVNTQGNRRSLHREDKGSHQEAANSTLYHQSPSGSKQVE